METLKTIQSLPIYAKGSQQTVYRQGDNIFKVLDVSRLAEPPNRVADDIKEYYQACKLGGVAVPSSAQIPYLLTDQIVVNKYSFEGIPLQEALQGNRMSAVYSDLLENFGRGLKIGLGLSSYHGQFAFDGEKTVFVDFFIPALPHRLSAYKTGIEAKNYYLVQFSPDSVMLSGLSHYLHLLLGDRQIITDIFMKFMHRHQQEFPIVSQVLSFKHFWWWLENNPSSENSQGNRCQWFEVTDKYQVNFSNGLDRLIETSAEDSLLIYSPRQRVFTKPQIIQGLNTYSQKYV